MLNGVRQIRGMGLGVVIPIFFGLALFFSIAGYQILRPTNILWITGEDPVQHYLGWALYRFSQWSQPLGLNPNFGLDIGASIIYSDSIPILAILFKAVNPLLTDYFQYFGLWILLCLVLQFVFAWKLLSIFSNEVLFKVGGLLLISISPSMLARIGLHNSLVGHFLLLAAFYLYLTPQKLAKVDLRWFYLVPLAAVIHLYLFLMVWGIWFAHLVDERSAKGVKHVLVEFIGINTLSFILLWQAGIFSMPLGSNSIIGYGGYGGFPLNPLGMLVATDWSVLENYFQLKNYAIANFNYLGLGVMLLLAASLIVTMPKVALIKSKLKDKYGLISILIIYLLIAISNNINIGTYQISFELPISINRMMGFVRAGDRFIWPVIYASIISALWLLSAIPPRRKVSYLVFLMGAFQIVDVSGGLERIQKELNTPRAAIDHKLQSPIWNLLGQNYSRVYLVPNKNQALNWEVFAAFSAKHKIATNAVYLARGNLVAEAAANDGIISGLAAGNFDPNAIYIVGDWRNNLQLPSIKFNPRKDLLVNVDGFNIFAPGWFKCKPCVESNYQRSLLNIKPGIVSGKKIYFDSLGEGKNFLLNGWGISEGWGVWSIGHSSELVFPIHQEVPTTLIAEVDALVNHIHPSQQVSIYVNNYLLETVKLNKSRSNLMRISLPKKYLKGDYFIIKFVYADPVSPASLGYSGGDIRLLSVGLRWIEFR